MVQARLLTTHKNNFLGQWIKKSIVKKTVSIRLRYWIISHLGNAKEGPEKCPVGDKTYGHSVA